MLCLTIAILPLLQLVPLPPWIWTRLPHRDKIVGVFALLQQDLPWLPISVSPSLTWASVLSLVAAVCNLSWGHSARLPRATIDEPDLARRRHRRSFSWACFRSRKDRRARGDFSPSPTIPRRSVFLQIEIIWRRYCIRCCCSAPRGRSMWLTRSAPGGTAGVSRRRPS